MEFIYEPERIYATDETGLLLAEVTFPANEKDVAVIDHTFVHESLRGQGIADRLLHAAADFLREQGKQASPLCSYAVGWFEKHPEYAALLQAKEVTCLPEEDGLPEERR